MLSGSDVYTTSVPVTTIPQYGLADTRSLFLAENATVPYNYAFPFDKPGDATVEFWVNPSQDVDKELSKKT